MTIGILIIGCVAIWIMPARYRLAVWIVVILAVVTPWRTFQDHADWTRVRWVPFVSPPIRVRDIVGNVALYVPFGMFCARRFGPDGLVSSIFCALLLSFGTETTQLFSHNRFPSFQDLLLNVIGSATGTFIGRSAPRQPDVEQQPTKTSCL